MERSDLLTVAEQDAGWRAMAFGDDIPYYYHLDHPGHIFWSEPRPGKTRDVWLESNSDLDGSPFYFVESDPERIFRHAPPRTLVQPQPQSDDDMDDIASLEQLESEFSSTLEEAKILQNRVRLMTAWFNHIDTGQDTEEFQGLINKLGDMWHTLSLSLRRMSKEPALDPNIASIIRTLSEAREAGRRYHDRRAEMYRLRGETENVEIEDTAARKYMPDGVISSGGGVRGTRVAKRRGSKRKKTKRKKTKRKKTKRKKTKRKKTKRRKYHKNLKKLYRV